MAAQLADAAFWANRTDAEALVEVDKSGEARHFTFRNLGDFSDALAAHLVSFGVKQGDRIALVGNNSAEHLIALLGVLKAGAVCCLINTKLSRNDRNALIDETGAILTLGDEQFLGSSPNFSIANIAGLPKPPSLSSSPMDDDALAVIMFTSGSSGLPKGVPITHAGYSWALKQFLGLGDTMAGRSGLVAAPLFHMNGQFHVLNMLSVGTRVILLKQFSARGVLDAVSNHEISRITGVPTMAALMSEEIENGYKLDTSGVSQVGLGSSPLSRQLLSRIQSAFPNATITNGFGTTETGPVSFGPHPKGIATPPTALGYPMVGVDLKLVDGETPDEGVLHIRNPMTLKGYWKRPDDSAKRITSDGWYVTGDRMRRDDDGFFYFVGRADDMMQVGAENVYPAEVERLLEQHPDVREAAVVPVPHATKNEAPVAFVIADRSISEEQLKAYTLAEGPPYAHPRRIFFLDALPLASTNKIDRQRLIKQASETVGGSL